MENNENIKEVNTPSEDSSSKKDSKKQNKNTIIILSGIIIATIIIISSFFYKNIKEDAVLNAPVAVVNGVEITQKSLNDRFNQVVNQINLQGGSIIPGSEDEKNLKIQVLENLINDELLLQKAKEAGIEISEEDLASSISGIIEQIGGEDNFRNQLEVEGISEDEFRDLVLNQMMIQRYMVENVNLDSIEITDKEVEDFYNSLKEQQGDNIQSLEEMRDQIKNDLLINKQRTIIADFIESIKKDAEITRSL